MNVRVLAATNRDPMQMIERGLLREDLYYRLPRSSFASRPFASGATTSCRSLRTSSQRLRGELGRPRRIARALGRGGAARAQLAGQRARAPQRLERAMIDHASDAIGAEDLGLPIEPPTDAQADRKRGRTAPSRCGWRTSRSGTSSRCSSAWADRRPAPHRCSGFRGPRCGRRRSGTGSFDRLPDAGATGIRTDSGTRGAISRRIEPRHADVLHGVPDDDGDRERSSRAWCATPTEQFLVGDAPALAGELTDALIVVSARVGAAPPRLRGPPARSRRPRRPSTATFEPSRRRSAAASISPAGSRRRFEPTARPGAYASAANIARELGRQLGSSMPEPMRLALRCPPGPVLRG